MIGRASQIGQALLADARIVLVGQLEDLAQLETIRRKKHIVDHLLDIDKRVRSGRPQAEVGRLLGPLHRVGVAQAHVRVGDEPRVEALLRLAVQVAAHDDGMAGARLGRVEVPPVAVGQMRLEAPHHRLDLPLALHLVLVARLEVQADEREAAAARPVPQLHEQLHLRVDLAVVRADVLADHVDDVELVLAVEDGAAVGADVVGLLEAWAAEFRTEHARVP